MAKSPSVGVPGVADRAPPDRGGAADLTAEVAFVRQFQTRVYGTALALLGNPDSAEAVAQEAFVRAWRHARTCGWELDDVAGRLFRTTRRLAIDAIRRRPTSVDVKTLAAGDLAGTSSPAGPVRAAVDSLPPEQAKALLLAALYGYTVEEIANAESVRPDVARTRIRVGLQTIRAQLADSRTGL